MQESFAKTGELDDLGLAQRRFHSVELFQRYILTLAANLPL